MRGPCVGLLVLLLAAGARGFTLTASGACQSVRVFDGAVSASVCKKVSGLLLAKLTDVPRASP